MLFATSFLIRICFCAGGVCSWYSTLRERQCLDGTELRTSRQSETARVHRHEGPDEEMTNRCLTIFDVVQRYIKSDNPQYNRYRQLQEMLRSAENPT